MVRFIALVATLLFVNAGYAQGLKVHDAWVKEAPPKAKVMAGYLVIDNHNSKARTLIGAISRSFGKVEVHRTDVKDGMARMVPQPRLDIAPHGQVRLEPGGYHLMLLNPQKALKAGDSVIITLEFADGDTATVDAPVKKVAGGHGHNGHGMNDHHH